MCGRWQRGRGAYTDDATILFGNYDAPLDGAAGFAFYPIPDHQGSEWAQGDIWINTAYDATMPEDYKFMTLMHEIGHALGLEHPGDYNAEPEFHHHLMRRPRSMSRTAGNTAS